MDPLTLLPIFESTPAAGVSLKFVLSLLSISTLLVAGWWFKKVEPATEPDLQAAANDEEPKISDDSTSLEVPKPKSRSGRWKSASDDEPPPLTPGEMNALEIEKKKVANLTSRVHQVELEYKALKREFNSPESNAKSRQILLEKNKAIAERNRLQGKLRKYKDKAAELEKLVAAFKESGGSSSESLVAVQLGQAESNLELALEAQSKLEKEIAAASEEKESLAALLEEKNLAFEQADNERGQLDKDNDRLEKELAEARNDADELCQKIDALQVKLNVAENDAKNKSKADELVAELVNKEQQLAESREELAKVRAKQKVAGNQNKRLVAELTLAANTARQDLANAGSELEKLIAEKTSLAGQIKELESQNAVALHELQ